MQKITSILERFIVPVASKIASNKSLQATSKGFMRILPVTMIGSMAYLICNFPIDAWTNWINNSGLSTYLNIPYDITIGIMAIYSVFAIAYSYAEENKSDAISVAIVATICFFIITPYQSEPGDISNILTYNFNWLSSKGLFVALITAIIVGKLYIWIEKKGWMIKMPEGVPPYVEKSFAALIPGFICSALFTVIAIAFAKSSYGNVHELIFKFLQTPLTSLGGSLIGYLLAQVIIQLLWWFGIHGMNVVASIMMPIWLGIDMARLAGESNNPFGSAMMTAVGQSTISCCIVMLYFCKSKQLKQLGKIALPAAVFNIGEPIVFGVPNVLNPYMFIPTVILVPLVTNLFFYIGFASGIVTPLSGAQVSMQVPVILYGLVQGNWMVALWQALQIPLAVLLFLPFYKMYDKTLVAKEKELAEQI